MAFKTIADRLAAEGHIYRPSEPKFPLKTISYILNNPVYLGNVVWRNKTYPGKHQPLIDPELFQQCQDIIKGRNRRIGKSDLELAGGLIRCSHCGQSISGEKHTQTRSDGSTVHHIYYRCANNYPSPDHPKVRWRKAELEQAIAAELAKLRIKSDDMRTLVRSTMADAFADIGTQQRKQSQSLTKRQSELKGMQDRLLNAYLANTIDESIFATKSENLKTEQTQVDRHLAQVHLIDPSRGAAALAIFDWSQNVAENWLCSNKSTRREILDTLCVNKQLNDVSLCLEMRSPFRELAQRPFFDNPHHIETSS
ncbi:MAG: recombinase family protein [Phycisphaerales bacterium]|nr:recombinase family protein [Phycisphaerales bacterium]